MKRLLMILFILVLTVFSISIVSCGSDKTPDSDTIQDTSSDTTENSDNQYVKDVSGDYWYCDSIIVSEDPSYYFMSGDKGDAGVFSDFALQSHGANVYAGQTNYLVCSIKGRVSDYTTVVIPNLEVLLAGSNKLLCGADAISALDAKISMRVIKGDFYREYNFDFSDNFNKNTLKFNQFQFDYGRNNEPVAATIIIPFTANDQGLLSVNFNVECPSLKDSENYYVSSTYKQATVLNKEQESNPSAVNVDKLSVGFLSEEKYLSSDYTDEDLTSAPDFSDYLSQYAFIDLELSSQGNDGTINVFTYFPTLDIISATLEDAPTSNMEVYQTSGSTVIKTTFSSLFLKENNKNLRIIVEIMPKKTDSCNMSVFVSGGELTVLTGDSSRDVSMNVASSGIEYVLNSDKTYYIANSLTDKTISHAVILNKFKGMPVLEIAPKIFNDYDIEGSENVYLESVTIGDNVTALPASIFKGCTRLRSVTLGNGITFLPSELFYGCSRLEEFKLPEGVIALPEKAFMLCNSLEYVTIPKNITIIPQNCFNSCKNLKSVVFEGDITAIGENAFYECESLESISLSKELRFIDSAAFCACTNLTEVIFEQGTNDDLQIERYAFSNCKSLKSIQLSLGIWHAVRSSTPEYLLDHEEINVSSFEDAANFLVNQCYEKYIITDKTYENWKESY